MNSVGCEKSKTEWNNLRFKAEEKQASTLAAQTYWLARVITLLKCVKKDLRLAEPENIWSVRSDYRHTGRYPKHIWFIPIYDGAWFQFDDIWIYVLFFPPTCSCYTLRIGSLEPCKRKSGLCHKTFFLKKAIFTWDVSGSREPSSCPARHFLETPRLSLQPPPLRAPGRCGGAGRSCDWRACRQSCRSPGTSSPQFCWD